jgi:hypothetical protein
LCLINLLMLSPNVSANSTFIKNGLFFIDYDQYKVPQKKPDKLNLALNIIDF